MTNRKRGKGKPWLTGKKKLKKIFLAFVLKFLFLMFHYINTLNEHSWVNQNVRKSSATSTQVKKEWKNSKYRFSFIICIIGKSHEHAFPNYFQC